MTAADNPGKTTRDDFVVAVSDYGQHALWRADSALPGGWRRQSAAMSRRACLDAIAAAWPDIAPARAGRDGAGRDGAHPVRPFVHEMVAEQASLRPDAIAVIAAGTRLTYRELDQSANRLARYLAGLGAGQETVIGVHLGRGAEAIGGLLAIMKAGCGYLPLDPSLPPARLARMCAEARPAAILTGRAEEKLPVGQARLIVTRAFDLARLPDTAPEVSLHPDHIGYAIYTSGSTGEPKAVAVSHGALACTIGEIAGEYQISAGDRVAQLASLAFDTSIEQVLVTLTRGATLMLPPPGTIAPSDLLRYLERERITVIDLTPAYWHQLLAITEPDDERLRSLRLMITGGDMADAADCRAALRAAPAARLLNAYGLTETTITSAVCDLRALPEDSETAVPVGRATRHVRIMILDENLDPVPAGTTGEIYIGGCGVARGYLGRPALTAERFLPDPGGSAGLAACGGGPGSRMYRTGDLGRWRADGQLEVSGRADRQLKVRGFRVEPGEIESALAAHPDIGQVAVVATGQGPGDYRLVAYYTMRPSGGATPRDLRRFLRARLPGYMIPAAFVPLDQMPLTPEGEPARGPLGHPPVPAAGDGAGGQRTPTQAGMTYLWSRLLKKDQVGLDDDFFALGGNSLLAAEMLARTRVMFGIGADCVRPLTRCLLRDPTLRGFAQATQDARAGRLAADGDQGRVDFGREADLGPVRVRAHPRRPRPDWRRPLEILLTGATGFLGAHLLSELLASTSARVWCLVRAHDAAHARQRIADAAARYDLGGLPGDRVVPLPGDLAAPRLGLSPGEFRELARSTDIIYHAGAIVNFIYPYEELRAANVTGTREVIRLAGLVRAIPVHYVSTTAVLAGLGVAGVREATEDTPLAHADRLRVGYVETKFVAEELLRSAGRAGLPVAIYRPMDIVGSRRAGAWNTATEMCALIRFITDTGLAPDIDLPLDFVPADTCAAAIRHISSAEGAAGRTYHLAGPGYPLLGYLVERLRRHGFEVSQVPFGIWVSELLRHAAHDPSHPMAPFLPLFVDRDQGLTTAEMYLEHVFPHYTRSNTEQALDGSGIAFPPVDDGLLDRNIGRLIATGYLTAPQGSAASFPGGTHPPGPPLGEDDPPHPPAGDRALMPGRHYPDWESFDFAGPAIDGPVAFGADLSPASVLGAYRRGIVPLPAADEHLRTINEFRYEDLVADGTIALVGSWHGDPYWVAWWSPDPRPVIGAGQVHLGRNVRKQLRRDDMRTTADTVFGRVAEECRTGREPRWLTDTLLRTLAELHGDGWAHSIEVWLDGRLIGGAIGIGIGRIISGDSLFGRHQGAARVAVADMAARLDLAGGLLIDAQWDSPFLRSLGAVPMPRERYLPLLGGPAERIALPPGPRPARRLLGLEGADDLG